MVCRVRVLCGLLGPELCKTHTRGDHMHLVSVTAQIVSPGTKNTPLSCELDKKTWSALIFQGAAHASASAYLGSTGQVQETNIGGFWFPKFELRLPKSQPEIELRNRNFNCRVTGDLKYRVSGRWGQGRKPGYAADVSCVVQSCQHPILLGCLQDAQNYQMVWDT